MSKMPVRRDREEISGASYAELLDAVKRRIASAQRRVATAINSELVLTYWGIGRDILERQEREGWGAEVIERLADDLRTEMSGGARGLSRRNLFYMRRFAALWPEPGKVQTLSAQIGWTHHIQLMDACGEDRDLYAWYAARAAEHGWSRSGNDFAASVTGA